MMISRQKLESEPNATGIITDYKDSTDPKYIGPGIWNAMHRQAYLAKTPNLQLSCVEFIKSTCYTFPCKVCKGHCTKYIQDNPPEAYLGVTVDGELLGLFVWTWKFHNAVNARLKKPIMSWLTAITLYGESSDNGTCSLSCLEAGNEEDQINLNNSQNNVTYYDIKQNKLIF